MANITNYLILNELKANIVLNSKFYRIFGINGDKILLVNNSDEVFAYGDNSNGLLGLGHNNSIEKRTKLNDLCHKQVVDITYGNNHVLALTKSGDCYSWGSNSFGQLGNGTKNDSNKPNPIHESFNGSIIQISCGSNYSFVLTNSRQVYAFGDNSFGQLGTGNHENQLIPIKVFSEEVIMISCGYWHSLVLTANGRAFGSGNNNNGELGLSNNENQNTFKSIMGFVNIKKISCGQNHSLLLTNDGKVYGFGLNNFGQILRSNEKKQNSPIKMSENSFIDIRSHFDSNISIALSSNGFYCIWGQTDNGVIKVPKETDIKSFHEIYSLYLKNKVIPKPVESDKKQKHNRVLKKLIESFNNPENSDLKIKIKDQYIYVHKTVLKLFCNHFISMLSVNWTESESNEIEIKEYSYSVYYSFLKYIYTDSIDIKAEEVNEILDLANSYFEEELKKKCIHFIINGISVENACDMYSIAVKYESQELENYCLEFASNKWNEIIVSDGYQNMDKTLLMKFMTKAANMKLFK